MKIILATIFFVLFINTAYADYLDNQLINAMQTYKTPVVGYAIINNNKIVKAKTLSITPKIKVNKNSIFQAASISKSVTAYGLLKLVDDGKINLNKPANDYLISWKIPENKYDKNNPVLVYQLLDMTSGLSVSGFAGYPQGYPLPTPIELLNGEKPANNKPVHVFYKPGSKYFYSGGAFQVVQQIISDITKTNFNDYMNKQILKPLGMKNAIYQYPLDKLLAKNAIPGYQGWNGEPIQGGWHNYAIAGSGGMWSTPTDLAKFILNVTDSSLGNSNGLLSQSLAKRMLTRDKNTDFGLGFVVAGSGNNLYFWKAGHNYGYHSLIIMFPNQGKGLAIMTNSESGDYVINFILPIIAKQYQWPNYYPFFDESINIPDLSNEV